MQIKDYEGAVKYLDSLIGKVVFNIDPASIKLHPPLDRMKMLLSLLDNPQEKFKSVLVGGTSGKGSTAYLISHILTTSGYKTGLTISPHLQKINERIQINGKSISDEKFVELLNLVIPAIEKMERVGGPARHRLAKASAGRPSYFEILIAMAFLYFAKEHVDIAVVEVGMGGEYDGTNTLYPLIAVLTNVSLDHTNILGGTVQKIAKTKAGIIKRDTKHGTRDTKENKLIVVSGVTQPSVIKIVEDRCKEVGAKLYRLHKDFEYYGHPEASAEGSHEILRSVQNDMLRGLELSLLGEYQKENASLAIETVRHLADFGFKISDENIKKALRTAFIPGRFEIRRIALKSLRQFGDSSNSNFNQSVNVARAKSFNIGSKNSLFKSSPHAKAPRAIVLDGAHNPVKMRAFLTSLKDLFPKQKKIFIVGFKFDKDIPRMLSQITKVADAIIVTEFDRATDISVSASEKVESIKHQVLSSKYKGQVLVEKDSKKALDLAFNYSITPPSRGEAGQLSNYQIIIVVTGSLYLVGEIRNML